MTIVNDSDNRALATNMLKQKLSENLDDAILMLADGTYFSGKKIGAPKISFGEICFNTSITGYQEILTDPSYLGQIINFTFPHIGNIGANSNDYEGKNIKASGLIIREDITNPANYRANKHFNQWLIEQQINGITKIDTRLITQMVRTKGAGYVAIITVTNPLDFNNIDFDAIITKLKSKNHLSGTELANEASQNLQFRWKEEGKWQQSINQHNNHKSGDRHKVVAIDYGAKLNILRCLTEVGFDVEVVGSKATAQEIIALNPDGVFLSNGPGDPAETIKYSKETILTILEKQIPIFGICLGHQLLALASGATTFKMFQGHRGANHPVQNLHNKKVEITSQNHGFAIDPSSLPSHIEVTHISLFDKTIEGIKLKNAPAFSVQYHPESSPGPSDSYYLFQDFFNLVKNEKERKINAK